MDKNEKKRSFMEKIFSIDSLETISKAGKRASSIMKIIYKLYFFFTIAGIPTTVEYFSHLKSSSKDIT